MRHSIRSRNTIARPPTWERFKQAVRKVDRDSILLQAARMTARIARGELSDDAAKYGLTPWVISDVSRTALAWSRFQRPEADEQTLLHLCNLNVQLADGSVSPVSNPPEQLGRVLARLFFEQFPGQRSVMAGVARTILLFGSPAQHPPGFTPEALKPGWFEDLSRGLTLDEYVDSLLLISTVAQQRDGQFSLAWLDEPELEAILTIISPESLRATFTNHLLTNTDEFKQANRKFQDPVPSAEKKFAFNPLAERPFIADVTDVPIAPWVQAIIAKASPPSVYHFARQALGDEFSRDLGAVFQHYAGRQLALIDGERTVIPEASYGPRRERRDSCDWFLELPGLLVLIECKARQPIESLRTGGADWLRSVEGSIDKGIAQLNRSNREIEAISAASPKIDSAKPRVGLVITLEPFYVSENWLLQEQLAEAEFPVGVISIEELESLVLLGADRLEEELRKAAAISTSNRLLLASALAETQGMENPLLASTWGSIGLLKRIDTEIIRLSGEAEFAE